MSRVTIEKCDNGWIVYSTEIVGNLRKVFTSLEEALTEVASHMTDWEQFKIGSTVKIIHEK